MEEVGGSKWKFIKITILNRFWHNNADKLPKRLFSSSLILDCGFLDVRVITVLDNLFPYHVIWP